MSIESSDLQADGRREGLIVLNAVLRNRAPFAQEYPALELTLTDDARRGAWCGACSRRVDYLGGRRRASIAQGIAPGGEAVLRVYFDTGGAARDRLPALSLLSMTGSANLKTLITGSIAYDTIMVFPDRFKNHLLADQLHILNVCFLTPEMRREFGGTAGNIAYNLKLLGEDPLVMATVGEDIEPYLYRLAAAGHRHARSSSRSPASSPRRPSSPPTSTTTRSPRSIPGAMNHSHENHIGAQLGAGLAIIGPDGKDGMLQHARECAAHGIPFLFDPGQGLPMFSGEELLEMVRLADYLAVNDYEGKLLEEKTGPQARGPRARAEGAHRHAGRAGLADLRRRQAPRDPERRSPTRCSTRPAAATPTARGCSTASRAAGTGRPTGRLGSVMGAIKIAQRGAQNHRPSRDEIEARYRKAFGYSPW